jgi:hypothetical protein
VHAAGTFLPRQAPPVCRSTANQRHLWFAACCCGTQDSPILAVDDRHGSLSPSRRGLSSPFFCNR